MTGVIENLRSDVDYISAEVETLKMNDRNKDALINTNTTMISVMQHDLDKRIGAAKDQDGNTVLTFEKDEVVIRDAHGELVCRIGGDVTIGELYKDSPISAVREFFKAMEAFKALES